MTTPCAGDDPEAVPAEKIPWWATAATREHPVCPLIYDKYGFATFEAVFSDLTTNLAPLGYSLTPAAADLDTDTSANSDTATNEPTETDGSDFNYDLVDVTGTICGQANITYATATFEPAPLPDDYRPAPTWRPFDDPPF
ncbi:hypothetical protein ACIGO9_31845 [Nocardia asteroides]|uniref:hypothetical protein n=1 Tax=Nocardia asteroides TaxID=1824 RepID=UPI0037C73DDF